MVLVHLSLGIQIDPFLPSQPFDGKVESLLVDAGAVRDWDCLSRHEKPRQKSVQPGAMQKLVEANVGRAKHPAMIHPAKMERVGHARPDESVINGTLVVSVRNQSSVASVVGFDVVNQCTLIVHPPVVKIANEKATRASGKGRHQNAKRVLEPSQVVVLADWPRNF